MVVARVRSYLETAHVPRPTVLGRAVARPCAADRIYFGCYRKTDRGLMPRLSELSGGSFRDGALARVLLMELWSEGVAPSPSEFVQLWCRERGRDLLSQEYAYLTDRRRGAASAERKPERARRARWVLERLQRVERPHGAERLAPRAPKGAGPTGASTR